MSDPDTLPPTNDPTLDDVAAVLAKAKDKPAQRIIGNREQPAGFLFKQQQWEAVHDEHGKVAGYRKHKGESLHSNLADKVRARFPDAAIRRAGGGWEIYQQRSGRVVAWGKRPRNAMRAALAVEP